MAVLQQCIIDTIPGTPGGADATAITRAKANMGLIAVTSSAQTGRNRAAYGSPVYEVGAASGAIKGVIGDYHNNRQFSLIRKGRVKIQATAAFTASDIGDGITAAAAGQATAASSGGIGEILGGGTDPTIGDYYIVDLNLP